LIAKAKHGNDPAYDLRLGYGVAIVHRDVGIRGGTVGCNV
jgi:hypothetical protein